MPQVSTFWLELAAGKPLSEAWARKEAQIGLDADELRDWLRLSDREQFQQLQAAVVEAAERQETA